MRILFPQDIAEVRNCVQESENKSKVHTEKLNELKRQCRSLTAHHLDWSCLLANKMHGGRETMQHVQTMQTMQTMQTIQPMQREQPLRCWCVYAAAKRAPKLPAHRTVPLWICPLSPGSMLSQ